MKASETGVVQRLAREEEQELSPFVALASEETWASKSEALVCGFRTKVAPSPVRKPGLQVGVGRPLHAGQLISRLRSQTGVSLKVQCGALNRLPTAKGLQTNPRYSNLLRKLQ